MGWRTILITEPSKLKLKDNNLVVEKIEQKPIFLPLEDVDTIIIESLYCTITTALLSQFATRKIAVILCDEQHSPNGMLQHIGSNIRHSKVAKQQVTITQEMKDSIWQELLSQKLLNQSAVLKKYEYDGSSEIISSFVKEETNPYIEGYAASVYFEELFPSLRRRNHSIVDARDSALNYGYMVVRAAIVRSIVASGLLPVFGVRHDSNTNPFNLADDLIEPFRPFVDNIVFEMFPIGAEYEIFLEKEHKIKILEIFSIDIEVNGKNQKITDAIEILCESFVKRIFQERNTLNLPIFR